MCSLMQSVLSDLKSGLVSYGFDNNLKYWVLVQRAALNKTQRESNCTLTGHFSLMPLILDKLCAPTKSEYNHREKLICSFCCSLFSYCAKYFKKIFATITSCHLVT